MDVDTKKDFAFTIIFKFIKDDTKEMKINTKIVENSMILTCLNFKDTGTGFSSPASIAKIEGKEMFLMFWSYLDGDNE